MLLRVTYRLFAVTGMVMLNKSADQGHFLKICEAGRYLYGCRSVEDMNCVIGELCSRVLNVKALLSARLWNSKRRLNNSICHGE